jgi:FixJ family two-component response regulator
MLSSKFVYLVEDDDDLRESVALTLGSEGYKVFAFADAESFLARQESLLRPCLMLLDMSLSNTSGVELQSRLLDESIHVPVIFISGQSTLPQAITAMQQGAMEFMTKPFSRDKLLEAVARAIDVDSQQYELEHKRSYWESRIDALAPREREVFWLLAKGFNNSQIQDALQISLITTKQYKVSIMKKLGVSALSSILEIAKLFES